ncbi:MAG TPA: M23 family metallopeptidase [Candidatus Aenigmarchaeota archaeon]|nr:MAG: hypothetical protein DRP03_00160 [Candidatus Aenigmarchaeota archaeon]HDD46170.1 M23 family metallopeptidase [Candidatus Aenigmarchaeota archaeon]
MLRYKGFADIIVLFLVFMIGYLFLSILSFVNKGSLFSLRNELSVAFRLSDKGNNILALLSREKGGINGMQALGMLYNNKTGYEKWVNDTLALLFGNDYHLVIMEGGKVVRRVWKGYNKESEKIEGIVLGLPLHKRNVVITSGYGLRALKFGYEFHRGVDFKCDGDDVYPALSGIVESVTTGCKENQGIDCTIKSKNEWGMHSCSCNDGLGNSVKIRHYIEGYGNIYTVYYHLKNVYVRVGERVNSNTRLGICGNTGYSSGPHLHFGIIDSRGKALNPCHYFVSPPDNCEQAIVSKKQVVYEFDIPLPNGNKGRVVIS